MTKAGEMNETIGNTARFKIDVVPDSAMFGVYRRLSHKSLFYGSWEPVAQFKRIEDARKWCRSHRNLPEYIS